MQDYNILMNIQNVVVSSSNDITITKGYNIEDQNKIIYLIEYSAFLIKNRFFDKKILNWQLLNMAVLDKHFFNKDSATENVKFNLI
jgi:hypothetical protein